MTLATDAEGNILTTSIGNAELRYGKLTMRDFATLQGIEGHSLRFNNLLDWCQTPAGALAVVSMASAKVDPTMNEEAVDSLGTPLDIASAAIDILNTSNGAGGNAEGKGGEWVEPEWIAEAAWLRAEGRVHDPWTLTPGQWYATIRAVNELNKRD